MLLPDRIPQQPNERPEPLRALPDLVDRLLGPGSFVQAFEDPFELVPRDPPDRMRKRFTVAEAERLRPGVPVCRGRVHRGRRARSTNASASSAEPQPRIST